MQIFWWILTIAGVPALWLAAFFIFLHFSMVAGWRHPSGQIPIFWSYLWMLALPGLIVRLRFRQFRLAVLGVGYAPLAGVLWMLLVGVINKFSHCCNAAHATYLVILLVCFIPILLLNLVTLWKRWEWWK